MDLKIGDKVWHIEIRKSNEEKSYSPNGIFINEHKIIGISKFKICIDSDWFQTFALPTELGKRKESYNSYLNDICIDIRTNNHLLGDGIFISMYSTSKPNNKTIDKMIAKCVLDIDRKYGWIISSAKDELYGMADDFKTKK